MTQYRVRFWDRIMPGMTGEEPILPTPRLLSEGHRIVEAYREQAATDQYPAVWRVRDDAYDPPGTVYRRVTVERMPTVWHCDHCGLEWEDEPDAVPGFGRVWDEYVSHECEGMVTL